MFFALIFALTAQAGIDEAVILKTFKKAPAVYMKFQSDNMKYRSETESYNEKEFEPAVEGMITLLNQGKCKLCLGHYLTGLSYLDGSASEVLTDQLKRILSGHSKELNKACKGLGKKTRASLSTRFRDASSFLADEAKSERKDIEAKAPNCF